MLFQSYNISLLIKQMNKLKNQITNHKSKSQLSQHSPSHQKSQPKIIEKVQKMSPRSNRIITLESKKLNEEGKKVKLVIALDEIFKSQSKSGKEGNKGYETPKFRCEETSHKVKVVKKELHNFFSFGEQLEIKRSTKKILREMQANKQNILKGRDSKSSRPIKKETYCR